MKTYYYLLYFSIAITTASCKENSQSGADKAIMEALRKFPQLQADGRVSGHGYKMMKSVRNGEFDFEIQLFAQPDSIKGREEILVFINPDKKCYPLPFFSNKYKDYWQFPFDQPIPNAPKVNTTFTAELNKVLDQIMPQGDPKKERMDYEVINELMYSVLNCRNLQERDSLLVYKTIYPNSNMPDENMEDAFIRLRKNYNAMKKEWHPEKHLSNYNCYLDKKNGRIYQLDFYGMADIKTKTYRQDCGYTYLSL